MRGLDDKMEFDDDDMDQESVDTDKSDSGSSGSASDEDDGELDVGESELRRAECLEKMNDLEQQFYQLKEHLFKEKTAQVVEKLKEVQAETAKEYREPVQRFEENLKKRLRIADIHMELQKRNLENKRGCAIALADSTLKNDQQLLYSSMLQELEDKTERLKQDRDNTDITSDLLGESQQAKKKRSNASAPNDKRRRPVTVSGPYVVYNLVDEAILEDYKLVKRLLKQKREAGQRSNENVVSMTTRYDDGRLWYDGEWYSRGRRISVFTKQDSPVQATISSINSSEVTIKRDDGVTAKLYINQLQVGKYTIKPAHNGV